ncbi:unnamed protein product [Phytomonas sp. Hart1]|nr:unnamed protein product [Phytomonas sp. Hart1]|eukprot:CCW70845.1 unnamed protein product [Phytomonas sp. isolate Hart1]
MQRHFTTFSSNFPISTIWTHRRLQTFSSCNKSGTIKQKSTKALTRLDHEGTHLGSSFHFSVNINKLPKFSTLVEKKYDEILKSPSYVAFDQNLDASFHLSSDKHSPTDALTTASIGTIDKKNPLRSPKFLATKFTNNNCNINEIKSHFRRLYPQLNFGFNHSMVENAEGIKTYTISVYFTSQRTRLPLSAAESVALLKFKGQSVGVGYFRTLDKALQQACAASGVSPPSKTPDKGEEPSTSLLSLYLEVLRKRCGSMRIVLSVEAHEDDKQVRITFRDGPRELASADGGRVFTLSLLLAVVEAAAIKKDAVGAARIAQGILNAPPMIVLSDDHIMLKSILRFLMRYHYGITDDDIAFEMKTLTGLLNSCTIWVKLPAFLRSMGCEIVWDCKTQESKDWLRLDSCIANTRKLAGKFVSVLVLERHFSSIFQEQLRVNPQIKELLTQAKEIQCTTAVPNISQGTGQLLEWALRCEGKKFEMEFTCLQRNTTYKDFGVHTRIICWRTSLSILKGNDRELVLIAYDLKKKQSELKAISAALAKRFNTICGKAITRARIMNLIDDDGNPIPCEGVVMLAPPTAKPDKDVPFLGEDPFLDRIKSIPEQNLSTPPPPSAPSLLSLLKQFSAAYAQHAEEVHTHEMVEFNERTAQWVALLRTASKPKPLGPDPPHAIDPAFPADLITMDSFVLASGSSRIQACALLQMYILRFKKILKMPHTDFHFAFVKSQPVQELLNSIIRLFKALPVVCPDDNIIEPVLAAVGALYGVGVVMHMNIQMKLFSVTLSSFTTKTMGPPTENAALGEGEMGESAVRLHTSEAPTKALLFLSQRHSQTLNNAIIECCRDIHNAHIVPCIQAFNHLPLFISKFELAVCPKSKFYDLLNRVATEIKNTSSDESCTPKLIVYYTQLAKEPFKVDFLILSNDKEVVMETVQSNNILLALQILYQKICMEIGSEFRIKTKSGVSSSHLCKLNLLKKLCSFTLGLPLHFENFYVNKEWRCRINLELNSQHRIHLTCKTSIRKNEAFEKAVAGALKMYFEDAEEASEKSLNFTTISDNYLYLVN